MSYEEDWLRAFMDKCQKASASMKYYMLDADHNPVMTYDMITWARWFEQPENRRVAESNTELYRVSTVCMGIDMGWDDDRPVLFETMVFEKEDDKSALDIQNRYCTWEEAVEGHRQVVAQVLRIEAEAAKMAPG